jgi:hypothetical protein
MFLGFLDRHSASLGYKVVGTCNNLISQNRFVTYLIVEVEDSFVVDLMLFSAQGGGRCISLIGCFPGEIDM